MKHFAVEVKKKETTLEVAKSVLQAAADCGYKFQKMESLDQDNFGSVRLQRFRMEQDPTALLNALFREGRAIVMVDGSLLLQDDRVGKVGLAWLCLSPRVIQVYRGPGDQYWKRQFGE